jgi:hypothetical protein
MVVASLNMNFPSRMIILMPTITTATSITATKHAPWNRSRTQKKTQISSGLSCLCHCLSVFFSSLVTFISLCWGGVQAVGSLTRKVGLQSSNHGISIILRLGLGRRRHSRRIGRSERSGRSRSSRAEQAPIYPLSSSWQP